MIYKAPTSIKNQGTSIKNIFKKHSSEGSPGRTRDLQWEGKGKVSICGRTIRFWFKLQHAFV